MLNNPFLRIIIGLFLASILTAGCTFGPATYQQTIQSSVSRGIIQVDVRDDGTVILYGWVEDYYSRQQATHAARQGEGVTNVVNRIHVIN